MASIVILSYETVESVLFSNFSLIPRSGTGMPPISRFGIGKNSQDHRIANNTHHQKHSDHCGF